MKVYEIIAESKQIHEAPISLLKNVGKQIISKIKPSTKGTPPKSAPKSGVGKKTPPSKKAIDASAKNNKNAAARADSRIASISKDLLKGAELFVTYKFIQEYYLRLENLEDQYEKYVAGDRTTEIFGDMDEQTAFQTAERYRLELIGEFTTAMGLTLASPLKLFKALSWIGSQLARKLGAAVVGSGHATLGKVLMDLGTKSNKPPGKLAATLGALILPGPVKNIALMSLMSSDAGQKFMSEIGISALLGTFVGIPTATAIDSGIKAMELAGVKVPDAVKTPIQRPDSMSSNDTDKYGGNIDSALRVTSDPTNNKVVRIGDVAVTDAEGYVMPQAEPLLKDLKAKAAALGEPDPTANLKRR